MKRVYIVTVDGAIYSVHSSMTDAKVVMKCLLNFLPSRCVICISSYHVK